MKSIHAKFTSIVIPDYELGSQKKLEKSLSIYNEIYFRDEPVGYYYDHESRQLFLPRGLDLEYLENIFNLPVYVDSNFDPYEKASYKLKVEPRNDIQRKSLSFLLGYDEFEYTKKHSQLALTLPTSTGKTYVTIAALSFMKVKSIIITHNNNIKQQWYGSFLKNTNIDERLILDIKGSSVINKILKFDKKLPYKVFLINHRTIFSYAKKNGWNSITELFKKLQVGVKVYDEAHLEFGNLFKTDIYTNTRKTFYLSATFGRSESHENKVFNLVFKNIAKFGKEAKKELRKHIIYTIIYFNSNPNVEDRASIKGRKGWLDRNKYSDYLMDKDIAFELLDYLMKFFADKEGKKLIMSSKIQSTEEIYKYLSDNYPNLSVGIYNSKVKEKEKSLLCDIISTTPKSLGTGTDIPGLRVVINFEPYSSEISANQYSGRLREYSSDQNTVYVELVDRGFPQIVRMCNRRISTFKKNGYKVFEINYK